MTFLLPEKKTDAEFDLFHAVRVAPREGIRRSLEKAIKSALWPFRASFTHEPEVVKQTDRLALVIMVGLQTQTAEKRRPVLKLLADLGANSPPIDQIRTEVQRLLDGGPLKRPAPATEVLSNPPEDAGRPTVPAPQESPSALSVSLKSVSPLAPGPVPMVTPPHRPRVGSDPARISTERQRLIAAGFLKSPSPKG